MLTPIPRSKVFRSSRFIDHVIAGFQQSYAADFNPAFRRDRKALKEYYDHVQPFSGALDFPKGNCVIACPATSRQQYITTFPERLQQFLGMMGVFEVYLLCFSSKNLLAAFEFESFTKRNQFKRMGAVNDKRIAYLLKTKDLTAVMPLFFFSGVYDVPVIFLFAANCDLPLAMRLCDDGNLHLTYLPDYDDLIRQTANQTGFVSGDGEICQEYYVTAFK